FLPHSLHPLTLIVISLICHISLLPTFFFFNDTPPTEIYTLSLHDALPISSVPSDCARRSPVTLTTGCQAPLLGLQHPAREGELRSEEHTSELQSLTNLVCRLLLEKKKIDTSQRYVAS